MGKCESEVPELEGEVFQGRNWQISPGSSDSGLQPSKQINPRTTKNAEIAKSSVREGGYFSVTLPLEKYKSEVPELEGEAFPGENLADLARFLFCFQAAFIPYLAD